MAVTTIDTSNLNIISVFPTANNVGSSSGSDGVVLKEKSLTLLAQAANVCNGMPWHCFTQTNAGNGSYRLTAVDTLLGIKCVYLGGYLIVFDGYIIVNYAPNAVSDIQFIKMTLNKTFGKVTSVSFSAVSWANFNTVDNINESIIGCGSHSGTTTGYEFRLAGKLTPTSGDQCSIFYPQCIDKRAYLSISGVLPLSANSSALPTRTSYTGNPAGLGYGYTGYVGIRLTAGRGAYDATVNTSLRIPDPYFRDSFGNALKFWDYVNGVKDATTTNQKATFQLFDDNKPLVTPYLGIKNGAPSASPNDAASSYIFFNAF